MPDHVHFLIWFEVDEENEFDEQDKPTSTLSCENNLRREKFAILLNGVGSGLPRTDNSEILRRQDISASTPEMRERKLFKNQYSLLSKEAPLNISKIIHRIKGKTAVDIKKELQINFKWQKNFYDFNIYTRKKYLEKLNYIHNNQYKDTRILNPDYYPYSSIIFLETGNGALKIDEIDL